MAESSSQSRSKSQSVAWLPDEIIAEILPRLPFKALTKFRCVSKSWLNFITSPSSNNITQNKLIIWKKYIVDRGYANEIRSYSLHSLFSTTVLRNGHNTLNLDDMCQIVGSSNGLVCLLTDNRQAFFIWNPSTGESKKLPISYKCLEYDSYGFGYDKVSDDYQVVHMGFVFGGKISVYVYSLRRSSCKKIGDFPYSTTSYPHSGVSVNGALIWKVRNPVNARLASSFEIVSLDLGNESYTEIAKPDLGVEKFYASLDVLEGCLLLGCHYLGIRADLWVMKEYGVRNSWQKLYTIPWPRIPKGAGYWIYILSNSASGEILLMHNNMLMIYNSRYGTFEYKKIDHMISFKSGATSYVESSVSP